MNADKNQKSDTTRHSTLAAFGFTTAKPEVPQVKILSVIGVYRRSSAANFEFRKK